MHAKTKGNVVVGLVLAVSWLPWPESATISATDNDTLPSKRTQELLHDVVLGPDGLLEGKVEDADGLAARSALVTVDFSGTDVAVVQTLEDGRFSVEGLREGTHAVSTAWGTSWFRFWRPESAPPHAERNIRLVARQIPNEQAPSLPAIPSVDDMPVRQRTYSPRRGFLGRAFATYPLLTTAGLLGAGIGSGIAIGSAGNNSSATP